MKPSALSTLISKDTDFWKRDLDILVPEQYLSEISSSSSISINRLRGVTISKSCSHFYTKSDSFSQVKWVLPLGIKTKNKRFGLQACPCCLKEDGKYPYFRKFWRLGFFTACIWHGVQLIDRCPSCHIALTLKKSYKNQGSILYEPDDIAFCHACKFDLRKAIVCYATDDELSLNKEHFFLYKNGYGRVGNQSFNFSNLYFLGIRRLLTSLLCNPKNKRLSRYLTKKLNLPYQVDYDVMMRHSEPEFLTLKERSTGFLMLKYILDNWPENFVTACFKSEVYFHTLYSPVLEYPFWVLSMLRSNLVTEIYRPVKEETTSASQVLESKLGAKPSLAELRRFMEVGVSYKPSNLSTVERITQPEYERIVQRILDILDKELLTDFRRGMLNRHLLIFMLVFEGKMSAIKIMALKSPSGTQNRVLMNWGIYPKKCHIHFKKVLAEYLASTRPLFITYDTDRLIISSTGTHGNIATVMTSLRRIYKLNCSMPKTVGYLINLKQ